LQSIAEQAGETRLRALALFRLGLGFYATGDYAQATDALRRSVELLAGELRVERIGTAGYVGRRVARAPRLL